MIEEHIVVATPQKVEPEGDQFRVYTKRFDTRREAEKFAKRIPFTVFGRRMAWGDKVTVYVTDGFVFETREEAEEFEQSDWPRPHRYRHYQERGWITSDRTLFPPSKHDLAVARQATLDSGKKLKV